MKSIYDNHIAFSWNFNLKTASYFLLHYGSKTRFHQKIDGSNVNKETLWMVIIGLLIAKEVRFHLKLTWVNELL